MAPPTFSDTVSIAAVAGAHFALQQVIAVSDSGTQVELSDVAAPGVCLLKNLDATNYVQFGTGTGAPAAYTIKLEAGEFCLFRFGHGETALYGIANAAPVNVQLYVFTA
jgi:hypothetical protein